MSIQAAGRVVLAFISRVLKMKAGFTKDFTPTEHFDVGGVTLTQAQIIARLDEAVGLFYAVESTRSAYEAALLAKEAGLKGNHTLMTDLDQVIRQHYGRESTMLSDFGIGLPKPRKVRTPQDKIVSSSHGKATRELHHIMGPQQRAAITIEGKPGLVLVDPQGKPVPGALTGPTPPGTGTPVEANLQSATPAASTSPAAETTAPAGKSPTGK